MNIQSLSGAWTFRQSNTNEWLPGKVPGSVHLDLLALSRIPDPFVADNEKRVQWVAETDWEYTRSFEVDPQLFAEPQIYLVCDGLDTLAEVRLNGRLVAATDNMFRQYRWDVKNLLLPGENDISVSFCSPVRFAAERIKQKYLISPAQSIPGGTYLRKAACQFGWDWGPKLPPVGIWKDIRLEGYHEGRISDVDLRQIHADGRVRLRALVAVERFGPSPLEASLRVTGPDGQVWHARLPVQDGAANLDVEIENPQLWWPNGYGAQPLYQAEIAVESGGEVLDLRSYQVGLRKLELRQEPDQWGRSFTFVVNDVPIFAKGSNWIPAETFHTRITDLNLDGLISAAAITHHNMLRVWGGGYYEDERFYDLCDRYGILVWQDFMFSCGVYPLDDPEFLDNIYEETTQAIRRLRHRACLALWCGNNEMDMGWVEWGWDSLKMRRLKSAYKQFFYQTLPEICAREDPDHPYWPSSPSSGSPLDHPNGQSQGDAHYWQVWHGRKPFSAYKTQYPRFMSEFGFQSLPPLETIRTFAAPEDWDLTSHVMEHHQRSPVGNALILAQMTSRFHIPLDFPSTVYLSMVLQAEGIRSGVEHWRRNKNRVSGTLYWQLNDVWPVTSWSSIDYYGRWKALHYAARRFYAPVLLSADQEGSRVALHLTNDLRRDWEGTLEWSLETLDGKVLESEEKLLSIPALDSRVVSHLDFSDILTGQAGTRTVLVYRLMENNRMTAECVLPFVADKFLALADPCIEARVEGADDGLTISLAAQSLARFVEVSLVGADVVFSDNYFDLPARQRRTISCPLPEGWDLQRAQAALCVRSLFNSYKIEPGRQAGACIEGLPG